MDSMFVMKGAGGRIIVTQMLSTVRRALMMANYMHEGYFLKCTDNSCLRHSGS